METLFTSVHGDTIYIYLQYIYWITEIVNYLQDSRTWTVSERLCDSSILQIDKNMYTETIFTFGYKICWYIYRYRYIRIWKHYLYLYIRTWKHYLQGDQIKWELNLRMYWKTQFTLSCITLISMIDMGPIIS